VNLIHGAESQWSSPPSVAGTLLLKNLSPVFILKLIKNYFAKKEKKLPYFFHRKKVSKKLSELSAHIADVVKPVFAFTTPPKRTAGSFSRQTFEGSQAQTVLLHPGKFAAHVRKFAAAAAGLEPTMKLSCGSQGVKPKLCSEPPIK
jgi:hypothetical protein